MYVLYLFKLLIIVPIDTDELHYLLIWLTHATRHGVPKKCNSKIYGTVSKTKNMQHHNPKPTLTSPPSSPSPPALPYLKSHMTPQTKNCVNIIYIVVTNLFSPC